MEIIGKGRGRKLILSAHEDEVANLIGFYFTSQESCPPLQVGDEIKISEMYEKLRSLARLQGDTKKFATELRNMANLLDLREPLIKAITDPEHLEE